VSDKGFTSEQRKKVIYGREQNRKYYKILNINNNMTNYNNNNL